MTKILVVEDEAVIREAYVLLLEANSYNVTSAANGHEALKLCAKTSFDIILLDLMMPELDGVGFLERSDLKIKSPNTRVVVMSNLSSGAEVIRAKELGAVRHEVKSDLAPSQVIEVIQSELSLASKVSA